MCIIPIFRPTCIFFCLVSTLTNRRKPWILPVQVHPPRPGSQRFVENEDGGLIVAMEKLNVQNIDDLLIQFAQVNHVGRQNGWFAVWDESNKSSKQIINVAEMTLSSKTSTKQMEKEKEPLSLLWRPDTLIASNQHTAQHNCFSHAPQWNGTVLTDQHTAQHNSFFPCTTVGWNCLEWPTHCLVQLFLPMHHSGMEPLTNTLPSTTLSTYTPQWTGTILTDQHIA